jgi:hypothetical protein
VAERLGTLVEQGVLERVPYSERPPRFEYRLTDKGRGLHPVILGLLAWGDEWMPHDDGRTMTVVHEPCGATVTPELRCPRCDGRIDPTETRHDVAGRP